jgi:UDP-N-acetylglucosamine/UDP-N-acetylgalactosamine diphosphorylase
MKNQRFLKIQELIKKGVKIPNPESVEIGQEVDTENISGDGVVIYSGCRLSGKSTLILNNAKLGYEGPAIIDNCQIGPQVELKGGFFQDAIFLKKAIAGSGSHIRQGTILEDESRVAHTVGLKHTILFPYVTLGSIINFCDCFMSGGTSRKDHSEVGSSYIHFNYTPNQDKATPSLIGDVPRGVMLNQRPIFLGGQGGLVGPCRLEFGTIVAAGSINRKDEIRPGRLVFEGTGKGGNIPFYPGVYRKIKRIVENNVIYISNLFALMQWYIHVRPLFVSDEFPEPLFISLKNKLHTAIDERIIRLKDLAQKMPEAIETYKESSKENASLIVLKQKKELHGNWAKLEEYLRKNYSFTGDKKLRDTFLEKMHRVVKTSGKDYTTAIKSLMREDSELGTRWLQGIVDQTTGDVVKIIPSFR